MDFHCLHSEICKTLANEKRQRILGTLRYGELAVSRIAEQTGMAQPTVSRHLALLRSKGLVSTRREGTQIHYSIANPKIFQAFDLITEVLKETIEEQHNNVDGRDVPGTDPEPQIG
jgi:ArsR family transcriptional regulator